MVKQKTVHICSECGHESVRWLGRCPVCKNFNTYQEGLAAPKQGDKSPVRFVAEKPTGAQLIGDIATLSGDKSSTKIKELDRVLSGGIVQGSLTLVGGEPGIGKSTLLLQLCQTMDVGNSPVLYVSGEESSAQIKLRAKRLEVKRESVYVLAETNLAVIEKTIKELEPKLVIIDSIQTMYIEDIGSSPGSVTQVRECTALFMRMAKSMGVSVIIVGHVTKDGAIAGPRILEHLVDTVLYFEGEQQMSYRIVRAVKNRFGSTNEIGVFEMRSEGLTGIENPSEYMLTGRAPNASGSVITCSMEGTRPILAEVQALVTYTSFGMPRRVAAGADYNRVVMLIAIIEKRAGFQLGNYDAYINIAGGMKINEPALDLAVVAAIASSFKNKALNPHTVVFGEAGLTGEARAVNLAEKRVAEAAKLGFKECILPQANLKGLKMPEGIRIYGVSNINELLDLIFSS